MLKKITGLYKQSYSGLSRPTWLLSLVMFINRSGTMVVPFISLYMTQALGYKLREAGVVIALFGLGAVCGGFLGGRMSGIMGFRNVQIITLAAGGVLFMGFGFIHSFYGLCAGAFVLSAVNESFRPANSVAIAAYCKPGTETRSYSLNRLAINLGWAAGGTLGGIIARFDYHLLFWIDGCTNLLAAGMLYLLLRPAGANTKDEKVAKVPVVRNAAFRDPSYILFSVCTMLYATCFFQMFSTMPVYFRVELGLREDTIGLLMALNGILIVLVEMLLVFRLEGKRSPLFFIIQGTLLVGLSFAIFNIAPYGLLIAVVSTFIITMGEMLSMPFMNTYWVNRSREENRSSYAGLYTVSWAAAQVIGPYAGTRIADFFDYTTLWWCVAGLSVVSAAGYRWLMQIGKREFPLKE